MSNWKLRVTLLGLAVLGCLLLAIPSFADSQVRIVRLSDVEGNVQIDRNTGQGYEKAFLNLPITQGVKLHAKDDGRAEVEFEDGSTLRIAPGTIVEFPELSLRDSGAKASTVNVQEGTAYLNFAGAKDNEFTLTFGHQKIVLKNSAHLRVEMRDTDATLAVFKGDVQIEGPSGTVEAGKKQSVTFDFADQDRYTLAKNVEQDPYDSWDKQQGQYHDRYLANSSYGNNSPYAYGVSDLNYYGSFFSVPGYGLCWQPYFVGLGWDPFMNGAWYWYPGFGYTWVSGYPWGWMPYRYGGWLFLPGYGWVWQQTGSSWVGWNTFPRIVAPPPHFTAPQPPTTPGRTVIVSRGSFPAPTGNSGRRMMIRSDSAGLGIPRGSIRDLGKVSLQVKQEGSAVAAVHSAPSRPVTTMPQSLGTSSPRTGTPSFHGSSGRVSSPPSAPRSSAPVSRGPRK